MDVTIKITNSGEAIGTVGWLAKRAAEIRIGVTKDARLQGAWLQDNDGQVITVLAIRDYYGNGEGIARAYNGDEDSLNLTTKQRYTDAAWEIIEELQALAIERMEAIETETRSNIKLLVAGV